MFSPHFFPPSEGTASSMSRPAICHARLQPLGILDGDVSPRVSSSWRSHGRSAGLCLLSVLGKLPASAPLRAGHLSCARAGFELCFPISRVRTSGILRNETTTPAGLAGAPD